ncbi:hypothetical protein DASB73_023690 [Starmerella bacillaris]|uniref:Fe2OG dioxygenase domain-containing protein n=1 Tax=Starmerella bacillaris TaxID=1247836 RepID=A0AAV5RJQ9_STABA|nr:hypothetical protein DASB73_023690 [Starmerella bacillaris]
MPDMNATDEMIKVILRKFPKLDPEYALDLIVQCDADVNKVLRLLGVSDVSKQRQLTFDGFISKSKGNLKSNSKEKKFAKPGTFTIDLYTPEQVLDAGVHCTMHFDVLEPGLANQLALRLNQDSSEWSASQFYLFDRLVTSQHYTALYTDQGELLNGNLQATYQGRSQKAWPFSSEMAYARDRVQDIVQLYTDNWSCNVVLANKYGSKTDKIDYHSDQLTHLGIKPTIAALSLGCTREFRLKGRNHQRNDPIYSIHVPHNSLLIMHSECQELYKHSVPPMRTITPDPLLNDTRISLTFRMYPSQFESKMLPRCKCNRPMILRTTLPTRTKSGTIYKYIWQCSSHYDGNEGCHETRIY